MRVSGGGTDGAIQFHRIPKQIPGCLFPPEQISTRLTLTHAHFHTEVYLNEISVSISGMFHVFFFDSGGEIVASLASGAHSTTAQAAAKTESGFDKDGRMCCRLASTFQYVERGTETALILIRSHHPLLFDSAKFSKCSTSSVSVGNRTEKTASLETRRAINFVEMHCSNQLSVLISCCN